MNKNLKHKKITFIISVTLSIIITLFVILMSMFVPEFRTDGVEEYHEVSEIVTTIESELTTTTTTTTSVSNVTTNTTATTSTTEIQTLTTSTTTIPETTTTSISTTIEKRDSYIESEPVVQQEYDEQPTDNITYYFYKESMRVHRSDCIYADSNCMDIIDGDYIDEARPCLVCNPDINIGTIYEPPYEPVINEEDDIYEGPDNGLERNWSVSEMTYYSGSYGCYGASGRTLINNYSVACNSIPLGTTVYIKSSDGSVDGYYRVDDTGGMGDHVIDIFYSDYSNTPSSFRQLGRVSCEVWIVG